MITFFKTPSSAVIAVETSKSLSAETIDKLNWLFGTPNLSTKTR